MIWSCALRPQKPVMACLAFLTLAGCANHGPVRDIVAEADDAQCRSYGARPGTDAYIACRTNIAAARRQAEAVDDAATDQLVTNSINRISGH
jgi:hypothetical protein